jgi:hypothetical protein
MLILYPDDFPADFVRDCSHAGDCDGDVTYWLDQIGLAVSPEDARAALHPYGAWDEAELSSHVDNLRRILWLAAGSFADGEIAYFGG